jgi:release factor glutamine methyltransferase
VTTATTTTFGGLTIHHDHRVLVPRPWTEDQSRWAAELSATTPAGPALELCTGAGHIGLLLARLSGRQVVAVDLDPVAGGFARRNAEAAGLAERFDVRVGPLDRVLLDEERFGLVVADPPWVPRDQTSRFPDDPLLAIDGGDDGLDVARSCLEVVRRHLLPGGSLVLQLGSVAQAEVLGAELPAELRAREVRTCTGGVLLHVSAD